MTCWHALTIPVLALGVASHAAPEDFAVRDGYRVTVAVDDLPGARFMAVDDRGILYVTRPRQGEIAAFHDPDADGSWEPLGTFISDKRSVHGIQAFDGWVWFTTSGSVWRGRDADGDGAADEVEEVVGGLPSGGSHWWRSLLVTPDGFYTSIGDAGNITDQRDTDRQKIWRFDLDGSNPRLLASGIRNTEKLRLRPGTGEVWGFDHGSDWFGREVGDDQSSQPM